MTSDNLSRAEILAADPLGKTVLRDMMAAELEALNWEWRFWARPSQLAPAGDWGIWLVLSGRGWGKTKTGAEWIRSVVCGKTPLGKGQYHRIAIVGETASDCRDVMVEGDSGLLGIHPVDFRPQYEPSKRRLTWPNGAVASLFNATEPDQLRGPQFDCFVAGTKVHARGDIYRIEHLMVGDPVLTRKGYRRVIETRCREATVGRIRFSNGSELIGTAEHPVLLSRGWTNMSDLREGDRICAIDASSGVENAGTRIAAGISNIAGPSGLTGQGFIGQFMRMLTAPFQRNWTYTIGTGTYSTMSQAISNSCPGQIIWLNTERPSLLSDVSGLISRFWNTLVWDAERSSNESEILPSMSVHHANTDGVMTSEESSGSVIIAEQNSKPLPETFAVSVVSTWEPVGLAPVFNIEVEDQPEYYANGVLVHNCAWSDESAKWRYSQETWDMLQFGLRLGDKPRQIVTTTPRPIKLIRQLLADAKTSDRVVVTRGSMNENRANLAASFVASIESKYKGTRLGRQELDAEVLEDVPDALWTREGLDRHRRKAGDALDLKRIVVAVDPAAKTNEFKEDGAATGIVAAGIGEDGRGYVLDDMTIRASPNQWARQAVALFDRLDADCIVAEINQGGDMVKETIQSVRPGLALKTVNATRGKWVRAEPIAALYEQGRVSHVGTFPELEDEMCAFGPNGMADGQSPDRLDALVWAFTELFPVMTRRVRSDPSNLPTSANLGHGNVKNSAGYGRVVQFPSRANLGHQQGKR